MPANAHCHDADDEWASAGNLGETWIDTDQNSHIIMSLMLTPLEEKKAQLKSCMH